MLGGATARPDSTDSMRRNAEKSMNAESIRKDGEDALNQVVDQFGDAAEHMEGAMHRAKDQLMEWEKQGMECAKDAAKQADQFVHDKPWQAVGIAAAVGLVAGLLISRR
jgi:ElaB/YqjD/DUF883 family membrane-anchored ribosome-binding protein